MSLVVKVGALAFIIFLPLTYAIQLQLLGGIWIIQTLPAIVLGLYTRWLDHRALLLGWFAGIVTGTWMAVAVHLKGSIYPLHLFGYAIPGYAAVWSLIVNVAIAFALSYAFRAAGFTKTVDRTSAEDYLDPVEE